MKKNDDYAKYLKYKMKYINAKNNLVGGNTTSILFKIIHSKGEDEYELKQLTEFSISLENKIDGKITNETILNLDKMSIKQVKEIVSNKLLLNKDKLRFIKGDIELQDYERIEDVIKDDNPIIIKPSLWKDSGELLKSDKYRKIDIVKDWKNLFIYISDGDNLDYIKKIIKKELGYREEVPVKYYVWNEGKQVILDENIFKVNLTFTKIYAHV